MGVASVGVACWGTRIGEQLMLPFEAWVTSCKPEGLRYPSVSQSAGETQRQTDTLLIDIPVDPTCCCILSVKPCFNSFFSPSSQSPNGSNQDPPSDFIIKYPVSLRNALRSVLVVFIHK